MTVTEIKRVHISCLSEHTRILQFSIFTICSNFLHFSWKQPYSIAFIIQGFQTFLKGQHIIACPVFPGTFFCILYMYKMTNVTSYVLAFSIYPMLNTQIFHVLTHFQIHDSSLHHMEVSSGTHLHS